MKCPACGHEAWRRVIRLERIDPNSYQRKSVLYRICAKCGREEKVN